MRPIKHRVSYVFRGSRLYVRLHAGGDIVDISTGYVVERGKWDGRRCRMSTVHDGVAASVINAALDVIEGDFERHVYGCELTDCAVDLKAYAAKLRGGGRTGTSAEMWGCFLEFLREMERERYWSESTMTGTRRMMGVLKAFDASLTYDTLTRDRLLSFVEWMIRGKFSGHVSKSGEAGYSNLVIRQYCDRLKCWLRWSVDKGYLDASVIEGWPPTLKVLKKPVVFLTHDEFKRVLACELKGMADVARDIFVFCCVTSLRVSDAMALKWGSVKDDYFEVVTKKTDCRLHIDLNRESRRILEKYRGRCDDFCLPRLALPNLNDYIKRVCRDCGITDKVVVSQYYGGRKVDVEFEKWELMSSHCGRRTFICNALHFGVPAHVVMKWTGHRDYYSMRPYIDVADADRRNAMEIIDNSLGM